ncbi:ankyrin repeat-containing protein [Anaeramoeba flamelloides]|uniref:Ankyrin repeat-containing protein n=1 Tax=Anaeramoeba flamelloides TaxID=1746091 RepID=A0AAV8A0C9_9EUKA|nr:ankyrin repeat-containing protein [Anaeramoeba flamelloides]
MDRQEKPLSRKKIHLLKYGTLQDLKKSFTKTSYCLRLSDALTVPDSGLTPLHLTCLHNPKIENIKYLLSLGCSFVAISNQFNNCLHFLALGSQPTITCFDFFLSKGISINQKNCSKQTIFHIYCEQHLQDPEIINYLLEKGANPNEKDFLNRTPFFLLCKSVHLLQTNIRSCLKYGANALICDKNDQNCFHILCKNPSLDLLSLQLIFDSLNQDSIEIEHLTPNCNNSREKNEKALVNNDTVGVTANPNTNTNLNINTKTPTHSNNKSKKQKIFCIKDCEGKTPFHLFFKNNSNIQLKTLQWICLHGGDFTIQDNKSNTAFHYLCQNQNITKELLQFALEKNVNPFQKGDQYNTPFHFICQNSQTTKEMLSLFNLDNNTINMKNINGLNALNFAFNRFIIYLPNSIHKHTHIDIYIYIYHRYDDFVDVMKRVGARVSDA